MQRFIGLVLVPIWMLVGCQGSVATPVPTPGVTVVVVVATPEALPTLTETPAPTLTLAPTATFTPSPQAPSRTPTRTPVRSTPTVKPAAVASPAASRPAPTAVPPAAPPGTLLDGDYAGTGSVRAQFSVSNSGTLASAGFFSFHCEVDQALSTYGFADPAPIANGKFDFGAVPDASGAPRVSMACTVTSATQARCVIKNLLATRNCMNTPANVNRK